MSDVTTGVMLQRTGLTFRQVDHWVSTGYLRCTEPSPGTGRPRMFGSGEVQVAIRMKSLVELGIKPSVACDLARGDRKLMEKFQMALSAIRVATGMTDSASSLTV